MQEFLPVCLDYYFSIGFMFYCLRSFFFLLTLDEFYSYYLISFIYVWFLLIIDICILKCILLAHQQLPSFSFSFFSFFITSLYLLFSIISSQLVLLSAFSIVSTATYSIQRPHRSPRLRALADASNLQMNLILLVLFLMRSDTAHSHENDVGNVQYSTDTGFLSVQCYGKLDNFFSISYGT